MKPFNPAPIRHVIWDWNGTLFNDTELCIDVMNTLLRRRGMTPLTRERYHELFDFPAEIYYARLGFDFSKESFEKLGAEFMEDYEQRRLECSLQKHALAALTAVRDAGRNQSVLSGYAHHTLEELLQHFGVREYFTGVLGSDNIYAKSKIGLGLRWIREVNEAPSTVLMIGDTIHDFEVAQAMGAACCLIADGSHPRHRLETCRAPVLDSLEELAGLFRSATPA